MFKHLGWAALATSLVGCTYSVHPLLDKKDLVHGVDLSGTWEAEWPLKNDETEKPPKVRLKLSGFDEGASYDFEIASDEESVEDYVLDVGSFGGDTYVQYKKRDLPSDGPPILDAIPVFGFARIEAKGDEIRMFMINDEWCESSLGRLKVPHVTHEIDALVQPFKIFTLPTKDLQAFVTVHKPEMFNVTPIVWRRVALPGHCVREPVVAPIPKQPSPVDPERVSRSSDGIR